MNLCGKKLNGRLYTIWTGLIDCLPDFAHFPLLSPMADGPPLLAISTRP